MKLSKSQLRWAAAAAGLAMVASLPAGLATAKPTPSPVGPAIKLVIAQNYIQVPQFGKFAVVDPGVYVAAFRSKLEFQVQRASYAKPLTIAEIFHPRGGTIVRPLPAWVIAGWNGLARFVRMTVKDTHGKTVASRIFSFCPNGNPQRTNPNSPPSSPFPQQCSSDPFELGMVLGLQRGWAADPIGGGANLKIKRGRYTVTVNIMRGWRHILGVSKADGTALVHIRVVKGAQGCFPPFCFNRQANRQAKHLKALPELPAAPTMTSPPKADLPDLSPLPSWGIQVTNIKVKGHPATSFLDFGATVWVGGNARLDVEGFRHNGALKMRAYQYFWHDGRIVGRARVGTMGFFKPHNHWHFQQFAEYRLLNAGKSLAVRSQKVGFCIAPSDPVDLVLPHASWVQSFNGFDFACGSQSALSVQEMLPVGWGDTYFQFFPGQSFDITHLPNGTYYIEIIANPEHSLHETNTHNDISLRRVILGGTAGHRTVRVPALYGIDPER